MSSTSLGNPDSGSPIPTMSDRVAAVEARLDRLIADLRAGPAMAPDDVIGASTLTPGAAVDIFEDMYRSRALDVAARRLKASGHGYYTISSAGHEMNAVVGAVTRPTDPALLHYRSGGLFMARARQVPGSDPVGRTARSLVAAATDEASGGRHKVWGGRDLWVIPQTSTIASHLPKATGMATMLDRSEGLPGTPPADAVVVCSFGDASANHASALAGVNAARYARRLGRAVPIVFVCEDNGIGISVPTPARWVAGTFGNLPHLRYVWAGGEVDEVHAAVSSAVAWVREHRGPAFLHLPTVRLWGHAGSDVEAGYRSRADIEGAEAADPLLAVARRLVAAGAASPATLAQVVADVREEVGHAEDTVTQAPHLATREQVMASLAPYDEASTRRAAAVTVADEERLRVFGGALPEAAAASTARTLAAHLNAALSDEVTRHPDTFVFGEDVGRKGGVYHVTARLQQRFGHRRVFDTLLDETTVLGLAQGAGMLGLLPIPEIQYLAYVHNALDQLRGEAASLAYFSNGAFTNPMVVRIAAFAYQRGFGGHFHNDNSIAALLDIPGLVVATPSRGDEAALLLRGCVATARANGRVVCLLEPIALYHERDLHEAGDERWLTDYPAPPHAILPGETGTHGDADADVVVLTYANGVRMSLRAMRQAGVAARVEDLRWLSPLPWDAIGAAVAGASHVVVVDECRASGGVADRIVARLVADGFAGTIATVASQDTYVPLGPAADTVLMTEDDIAAALTETVEGPQEGS